MELIGLIHWFVRAVLTSGGMVKYVVAMRELQYMFPAPDWGAAPTFSLGFPWSATRTLWRS